MFGTGGAATGGRPGVGGASSGGSAGASSSVTFAQVAMIVGTQCGTSTCHGGRQNPSLSSSNLTTLYSTLTNTAVSQCGGDHLVTKSDTANSALLELPQHQCNGLVMPQGCTANPCFAQANLDTISSWIKAGAPGP
jgi:hypothetical protein